MSDSKKTIKQWQEELDIDRLIECIPEHQMAFAPFVEMAKKVKSKILGESYGSYGDQEKNALNLVAQMVRTFTGQMTGGEPKPWIETDNPQYRPKAAAFQRRVSKELTRLGLKSTARLLLTDALIRCCVRKIALEPGGLVSYGTYDHTKGTPFFAAIELDNLIPDMSVTNWKNCNYFGDRYLVDLEWAQKNEAFDPDVRKALSAEDAGESNPHTGDEPTGNSGTTQESRRLTPRDQVWLMDIYFPRANAIVTMPFNEIVAKEKKILMAKKWTGPTACIGPYDYFGFGSILGYPVPWSPADMLMTIHVSMNALWNKAMLQARSQKTVTGANAGHHADGSRLVSAKDGSVVSVASTSSIKQFGFPGADAGTVGMISVLQEQGNEMAGNLRGLGGLSQQADTLGQEQILTRNGGVLVEDMDSEFWDFIGRGVRDIGFYVWNAPDDVFEYSHKIKGTPYEVPGRWDSQDTMGDFEEYGITVDYTSMVPDSPQRRLALIDRFVASYYGPLQMEFEKQGKTISIEALLDVYSKLTGTTEVPYIWSSVASGEKQESMRGEDGSSKPSNTTRNYVRRSEGSADTDEGFGGLADKLSSAGRTNSILAAQMPGQ
ncbi:MAG: hypothetical protein M0R06_03870 [Sphaerochaeta sp.]|jgi:hypothetical protein|nr:hypothetical protein [Sphaerochaeta sp.]